MTEKEQLDRDLQEYRRLMAILSRGAQDQAANRIFALCIDAGEAAQHET